MKKAFASIAVITATFVLSGCGSQLGTQLPTQKEITDNAKEKISDAVTKNNPLKSSREDCITGCNAIWKSNKGNDGKPESKMISDCGSLCDAGQGMQNKDAESCAKAEGILKDTCYVDVAKSTKDPKLCEKITEKLFISSCYIDIAKETKDASLCEKITEKIMKSTCLEGVK